MEHPDRDRWQQPARLVEALGIREGSVVADFGTGSGYMLPYLDRAVGRTGRVVATDIDADLLALARRRVEREGLGRVELRQGEPTDPALEDDTYDVILVVDTYHHLADPVRGDVVRALAEALRPGGRIAIVEFKDGDLPVGPAPGHKLPRAQVERELTDAGLRIVRTHEFLEFQYVLEAEG
jgi:ubiquinone/menaquinone biosynthesis C-methylase UbiE